MAEEMTTNSLNLREPVVIVGAGKTGLSCARYLALHGVPFSLADSREHPPGLEELKNINPDIKVMTGAFTQGQFIHAGTLIVSPGVQVSQAVFIEAEKSGAFIIGDIELFARQVKSPVIAITGSNGKTTVTSLLGEMAKQANMNVQVAGNIGTPVLDLLSQEQAELYVLELSSFQLETTQSLNTVAAALLNISEDHMDRYKDINEYIEAKANIFQGDGAIIFNQDDHAVTDVVKKLAQHRVRIGFTLGEPANDNYGIREFETEQWLYKGAKKLLPVSKVAIKGAHNIANAMATLAMGEVAGIPIHSMLDTLTVYKGLPHRMQWVTEYKGVNWFNDSKATNVGAAIAAINGVAANRIVLIAGGQGKDQNFEDLGKAMSDRVSTVVLIGEDAKDIAAVTPEGVEIIYASDMNDAVIKANAKAGKGDAVLLSPACASFDMFSGYEHRGEIFIESVRGLTQ